MSVNLAPATAALAPLSLTPTAVSGGVSVIVDSVKVTLKDRGNYKVYFTGKEGPARAKALAAALSSNETLKPFPLTAGTIKFGGATVDGFPDFIRAVRSVVAGDKAKVEPAKVPAIAAPAKADKAKLAAIAAPRKKA